VRPFSINQLTTLRWPFERDIEFFVGVGVSNIGVSIVKLEECGIGRGVLLLRESGLRVSCLTSSGVFPLGDEAGEAAALERTRRHIDLAAEVGADCLMLLPGNGLHLSWEESAARARGILEKLLPAAQANRVRLGVESTNPLQTELSFLRSFDESLDFAAEIRSPWLGVVLEVNEAWGERRLYKNLRYRTDMIALVQVSDFKVGTLAVSDRVVPGDGDVPLRRILRALSEAGYRGWYDIELVGPRIEAEGYESVVPRAMQRFEELWS
jgi:sugar phosphate isomerase/epimerase